MIPSACPIRRPADLPFSVLHQRCLAARNRGRLRSAKWLTFDRVDSRLNGAVDGPLPACHLILVSHRDVEALAPSSLADVLVLKSPGLLA